MNNILILIGESGSGKTTVAEKLMSDYGFKMIDSYTTRPMREPNETGHTFVSDSEFDALEKVVGFTNYHGYRYCATESMVDEGDIYIIDPSGVEFFKNNYHGTKNPIFVKLEVSDLNRYLRMINRGDTYEDAMSRIEYDRIAFFGVDYDMTIKNNDINRCVEILSLLFKKGE